VNPLVEALSEHPDLVVRQRAAWALGKIGSAARGACGPLEAASKADDPRLAKLAADALAEIGS
jgi:HEAT repeat protein